MVHCEICMESERSKSALRVRFKKSESESESKSDIASRWINRKSNLMFTSSSDKDQRKTIGWAFRLPDWFTENPICLRVRFSMCHSCR